MTKLHAYAIMYTMSENLSQPEQSFRPGARRRLAHLAVASTLAVGAMIAVESGAAGDAVDHVFGPAADVPSNLDDARNMPEIPPTTDATANIDIQELDEVQKEIYDDGVSYFDIDDGQG